ncbi:golgin candidate 1 [Daucus carota subsp. sativus]|uniref:golgin candidate 1 n=1 Tax=Daucus carota subsp. sativus TaxID=79200 RepID=UPI0007EFBB85|nr:PREDICTED: golgin candidate 1 [Daucus carota subsp. sativus]
MAHWLKAAEDLFEVVDRRAKLVVGDKPDEESNSQAPVSNGRGSKAKKTRGKSKPSKKLPSDESSTPAESKVDQTSSETSRSDVASSKDGATQSIDNNDSGPISSTTLNSNEEQQTVKGDDSVVGTISSTISDNEVRHVAEHDEVSGTVANVEIVPPASDGDVVLETPLDGHHGIPSSSLASKSVDISVKDHAADSVENAKDTESTMKMDQEKSQAVSVDAPIMDVDAQLKVSEVKVEARPGQMSHQENKDVSPAKVQEQLDEAQGLLKSAISTGQSKEARLARVCAGLSSRLQEYKSENAQLEELLISERELSKSYEMRIHQLEGDLSSYKTEVTRVESNMAEALAAKNFEIESLVSSMDAIKKQAALSEGNLASLQASMESIMRNRELTETRMMQALKEELSSVERRAEEERAAHNATKMAAMEREVELEHRALDASTALARIQRTADERMSKTVELEKKIALLEVECSSLNQELQDMEVRNRRGQKKSPEEANQAIQIQAWQDEVERARQGQRDAESKLSSLEAELQKMRVEMASMKRDAEHYSRQEHMELEKRYRDLTDLLYYKQTQLEAMSSEKTAAEFQLEKEMKRIQEVQIEVERSRVPRRGSSSWEEDTDMKALEPLPLHHRHMAGASIQLQKAAKLLDFGAVRATRFLWRYPVARVLLLFYLVFVHLFLMYLLHRLQEQDDTFASREVAESMGLVNSTLLP